MVETHITPEHADTIPYIGSNEAAVECVRIDRCDRTEYTYKLLKRAHALARAISTSRYESLINYAACSEEISVPIW